MGTMGDFSKSEGLRYYFLPSVVVAFAVRLLAARGELWLDEIRSLFLVRELTSGWQVFTRLIHETNHILYSWFLHEFGPGQTEIVYRLPSIAAGALSVVLAGALLRRSGKWASITGMGLTATSYLLVHYGSEARGYALAVCFSYLSVHLHQTGFATRRGLCWVLFPPAAILGFLSNLTYAVCYAGLLAWSLAELARAGRDRGRLAVALGLAHLPVIVFGVWHYLRFIKSMAGDGGDVFPLRMILTSTASLALGGGAYGPGTFVVGVLFVGIVAAEIFRLGRTDFPRAVFFATSIVIAPALLLLIAGRDDIAVRYFLVSIASAYLLLAHFLGRLLGSHGARKRLGIALCVAWLMGNGLHCASLIGLGRGHYREILVVLGEQSPGPVVTVGGDLAFRHTLPLAYYAERVRFPKPIRFVENDRLRDIPAEWMLFGSQSPTFHPGLEWVSPGGDRYRLERDIPFPGLSGWRTCLYKRSGGPATRQPLRQGKDDGAE